MLNSLIKSFLFLFFLVEVCQSSDRMNEQDFKQWLVKQQQNHVQDEASKEIKQLIENIVLTCQIRQKNGVHLEKYVIEELKREGMVQKNALSQNTNDLYPLMYSMYCSALLKKLGHDKLTNENQKVIGEIDDMIRNELSLINLNELIDVTKKPIFDSLNGIYKGIIERIIINKKTDIITAMDDRFLQKVQKWDGIVSSNTTAEYFDSTKKTLHFSDNLFYTLGEDLYFKYAYGPKIFERQNSSGKNNCCLLFSIIDTAQLYAKVMGIPEKEAHDFFWCNPELANQSPEECEYRGIKRRDFTKVREKFFDDILNNLGQVVSTEANKETSIGAFLVKNFLESEFIRPKLHETNSFKQILDWLHSNDHCLDSFFATIFGWLYNEKIVVLNGVNGNGLLENVNLNNPGMMPVISTEDVPNLIYVYIGGYGGHYQKLKLLSDKI